MTTENWDLLGQTAQIVVGQDGVQWRWKVTVGGHTGPAGTSRTEDDAWRAATSELLTRVHNPWLNA